MSKGTNPEFIQDWLNIAKTPTGQRIIWRLLGMCGTFESPFNPKDPRDTDYLCGRHAIGLEIMHELEQADPTLFPRLILNNLEKNNDSASKRNTTDDTTDDSGFNTAD